MVPVHVIKEPMKLLELRGGDISSNLIGFLFSMEAGMTDDIALLRVIRVLCTTPCHLDHFASRRVMVLLPIDV